MFCMNSPAKSPHTYLFFGILALGTALRFFELGTQSLWLDEALSWSQAQLPVAGLLKSAALDVHPPLYSILLHASISILGASETSLRLISAICGVVSIWLAWQVFLQLMNKNAALLATLLFTISYIAVSYSQEARMYSLMLCLTLATNALLLRISNGHKPAGAGLVALYISATVLLLYTHIYGLFVLLAHNLYMAFRYACKHKQIPGPMLWAGMQSLILLLFSPWLVILFSQVRRIQDNFWLDTPTLQNLLVTLKMYSGSDIAVWLSLLLISFAVFSLRQNSRANNSSSVASTHSMAFLFIWLLTPILVPFAISQFTLPVFNARYTIVSSPAWFGLTGIGIQAIRAGYLRYSILALLTAVMSGALVLYFASPAKTNWRTIVPYIETTAQADGLVLFHTHEVMAPYRYYASRNDLKLAAVTLATSTTPPANQLQAAVELARNHQQLWLVSGYDIAADIHEQDVVEALLNTHTLVGDAPFKEVGAIRVFQFRLNNQ
jgi:mannosyltransferase